MDRIEEPPALLAARVFYASKSRQHLQRGKGKALEATPSTPKTPTVTIASLARKYNVSRAMIHKHVKALEMGCPYGAISPRSDGRPRALTDAEDTAVVNFAVWLERCGCPAPGAAIVAAADQLRSTRVPPASALGKNWLPRWLVDHPELTKTKYIRPRELPRASVEADPSHIVTFFDRYEAIVRDYQFDASAIWNVDEAGCRIGCLNSRMQVIVARVGRRRKTPEVLDPSNRESCTLIGCGNAVGDSTPPYAIFKVWPLTAWDTTNHDQGVRFARSDTGFSNQAIMMDWIKQFNAVSFTKCSSFLSLGVTLEQWYGCNHLCLAAGYAGAITPDEATEQGLGLRHQKQQRIYRLLLLDGFSGHVSIELQQYCIQFDIIIGFFPAHLTHLLQPMDVGVFQHLKKEHQRVLYTHISQGNLTFNRTDFVAHLQVCSPGICMAVSDDIQQIWQSTFTPRHVMDGFEKAGIWPINRTRPLEALAEKQRGRAIPGLVNLLPKAGRQERAMATASHINHHYRHQLSSPTRQGLDDVLASIADAITFARALNNHVRGRETRLQLYQKQRRTRKKVAPSSDFITSVSVDDIRQAAAAEEAATQASLVKAQIRDAKKEARQAEDDLKDMWREDKLQQRQLHGREIDRTFRGWLQRTGRWADYVPFNPKDIKWAMPGDPRREADSSLYAIDVIGGALDDRLRRQIQASARPLRDIDLRSDGSVEFLGLDPGPASQEMAADPDLFDDEDDDDDDVGGVGMPSSPPDITPTPAPRAVPYKGIMGMIQNARAKARDDGRLVDLRSGL